MSNYNRIAWVYDGLARLVFGSSIQQANQAHIKSIPEGSQVLILGGGTGNLLLHFKPRVEIEFVDSSIGMIERAKKKSHSIEKIDFIHLPFEHFLSEKKYDFIICPFFLDLFEEGPLRANLTKIMSMLHDKGQLIVSDFNRPSKPFKWLKSSLLFVTILFFRISTGLKTIKLLDLNAILSQTQLKPVHQKNYFFGMIFSSKWIKTEH